MPRKSETRKKELNRLKSAFPGHKVALVNKPQVLDVNRQVRK